MKEDPNYPEALIGRGTAFAFQRELEAAIADFTKVLWQWHSIPLEDLETFINSSCHVTVDLIYILGHRNKSSSMWGMEAERTGPSCLRGISCSKMCWAYLCGVIFFGFLVHFVFLSLWILAMTCIFSYGKDFCSYGQWMIIE